jgi:hypothetical protein
MKSIKDPFDFALWVLMGIAFVLLLVSACELIYYIVPSPAGTCP